MAGQKVSVANLVAMSCSGSASEPIQTIMYDAQPNLQGQKRQQIRFWCASEDVKQIDKKKVQELNALHIKNLSKSGDR